MRHSTISRCMSTAAAAPLPRRGAIKGGISLDMRKRFNKILSFNEVDQTITVQAGLSGPALEEALQDAPNRFGAKRQYTCGHFPQSFEYSSVGGWVVTRGAGQNSTYYGTIADIVLSQKYATPIGRSSLPIIPGRPPAPISTRSEGSEGTFGVLTEVTLKVFRWQPENRKRFLLHVPGLETAMAAAREMMQCDAAIPRCFAFPTPKRPT